MNDQTAPHASPLPRYLAAAALILLSACSSNAGTGALAGLSAPTQSTASRTSAGFGQLPPVSAHRATQSSANPNIPPNNCPGQTPSVWSSDLGTYKVYGYTSTGGAPCVTLDGTEATGNIPFDAPFYLATDNAGNLYVTDLNNGRVIKYTKKGIFVLAISTTLNNQAYQPEGVCVSPGGVLGVSNRAYNNYGPTNVEFFNSTTGAMIGYATSSLLTNSQACAFDRLGDFIVDGMTGSGEQIFYLSRGNIAPNATLISSNLPNTSYWLGLYSRKNGGPGDFYLSAASVPVSCNPGPYCENITTWKLSNSTGGTPAAGGPIYFTVPTTSPSTCSLTGYPNNYDSVFQVAPSAGGLSSKLYLADYANASVEAAPGPSCAENSNGTQVVSALPFATSSAPIGIATHPTGQY